MYTKHVKENYGRNKMAVLDLQKTSVNGITRHKCKMYSLEKTYRNKAP